MGNLDIYERYRKVPAEAQKPIEAGRLIGKTDINPMWRIKSLTEEFGACGIGWYTDIVDTKFMTHDSGEVAVFVDIYLFIKDGENWSAGIRGTGGAMFVAREKNGLHVDDEAVKKAYTDALSVCCKMLGFGADVYWQKDSTKYDNAPVPTKAEKNDTPKKDKTETINKLLTQLATLRGQTKEEIRTALWNALGFAPFDEISNLSDAEKDSVIVQLNKKLEKAKTP